MDEVPDEGLWLSLSDLARERGVSKQALAKRVERLERLGHLATRPGPRGAKLVNAAGFDRAAGLTLDAVRALNGTGAVPAPVTPPAPTLSADPVLAREQARRAAYDADLKKLDLLERLGLVLPTVDVRDAIVDMGMNIVRALDRLASLDEALLAAARDGRPGARRFLKDLGQGLRSTMATALEKAAELQKDELGRDLDSIDLTPAEARSDG